MGNISNFQIRFSDNYIFSHFNSQTQFTQSLVFVLVNNKTLHLIHVLNVIKITFELFFKLTLNLSIFNFFFASFGVLQEKNT